VLHLLLGSQEERCNVRCDVLYWEGEPQFEVFLSLYVLANTWLLLSRLLGDDVMLSVYSPKDKPSRVVLVNLTPGV